MFVQSQTRSNSRSWKRELLEQEESLRLSESEREAMIRDLARKLYMAATRAGQRLVITYVGEIPEVIRSISVSQSGANSNEHGSTPPRAERRRECT
jgi:ATP-dependent exoDNAse (exonuclease V) beta subunit